MEGFIYSGKSKINNIPPHRHSFWEIMYYYEGTGTLVVENDSFPISAGNIACIPPYSSHREDANEVCSAFFIGLKHFESNQKGVPVFKDHDNEFFYFFDQMAKTINSDYENRLNVVYAMFEALSQLFIMRENDFQSIKGVAKLLSNKILQELQNPYFEVGDAINELDMHPTNVRKHFKREFGVSPNKYLLLKRIEIAQQMLRTSYYSGLNIKKIANVCGFSDQYYFSKIYKQFVGKTPSEEKKLQNIFVNE